MTDKTLEDYATVYLETIGLEVRNAWAQADIIAEFMDNCIGGGATSKEVRQMMSALAEQVRQSGHSAATLMLKGKVAKIFPAEAGVRHPDVAFSIYGVCAKTSRPAGWLSKALEKDWTVKQLRAAIHEASGRPGEALKAILDNLAFFGLGTEAQVAALTVLSHSREPEDALTLRGIRDMLGGLRRMMNGKGYVRQAVLGGDAGKEIGGLAGAIERWRIR